MFSLWKKATNADNYTAGVKVKFKSLISASGHIGPIVLHFSGMNASDISVDFVVYEVPGLCIGSDVIPDRNDIGYVILSRNAKDDVDSGNISMTEKIMK